MNTYMNIYLFMFASELVWTTDNKIKSSLLKNKQYIYKGVINTHDVSSIGPNITPYQGSNVPIR